jgi:hypothetical protein
MTASEPTTKKEANNDEVTATKARAAPPNQERWRQVTADSSAVKWSKHLNLL